MAIDAEARPGLGPLAGIRHIVVLMMENRSFDHMLGYLMRAGLPDVRGLAGTESNADADGTTYTVHEFAPDQTAFHTPGHPLDDSLDPCHAPDCVAEQLAGGNAGFVKNFVEQKSPPPEWRDLVMGYYTATHLPVYDFLARNYCVCDAWHSSIPGDTWPNRLYSLAGREADPVTHKLGRLLNLLPAHLRSQFENAPIYEVEAFTRQLADDQWRWYSHDPGSLRAADERYRDVLNLERDNFAYFNRKEINLPDRVAEIPIFLDDGFLDDAANSKLRDVSWIDPNFVNLRTFDSTSNDDHPPSDVHAGQELVLTLYDALTKTPDWNDTLLVITYDEHGGFYDHVEPPAVPDDDGSKYRTLGVRVPALVVGPRVRREVCHTLFDHTSLISTILRRFAPHPAAAVQAMGKRTARANHLGVCLQDAPRADIPDHGDLFGVLDASHMRARAGRRATPAGPSRVPDGAGHPIHPHEFQREFLKFALLMRLKGLRAGMP